MTSTVGTTKDGKEEQLLEGLESAKCKIAEDQPVEALKTISTLLVTHANDPRPFAAAFQALSAAVTQPNALSAWHGVEKSDCYRRILLQPDCLARPLVFHHGVASLLTSKNTKIARAITCEVKPVLYELLNEGAPPKALVLFLLVVRSVLGSKPSQESISKWHGENFARFDAKDLELPYSTMFNAAEFGANRDDLLWLFPHREAALNPMLNLGLAHLLLLEWLTGKNLFVEQDNSDLLSVLVRRLTSAEAPVNEKQAARSLIMRHWKPGSEITTRVTEELGLGKAVLAAIERRNRTDSRSALANACTHHLHNRCYQAAQVARGLVARVIPALNRGQRRVKVAVCVSGQLRGYRTALDSWRKSLLADADCDIYVHTWNIIGRAGAQPYRSVLPFAGTSFCSEWRHFGMLEGYEAMQARYPSLFAALEVGARIDAGALEVEYSLGTEQATVVLDDEFALRFADFSNQDKMHYKIQAAHDLATASGKDYDLFVRIRPDLPIKFVAFDWRYLAEVCRTEPVLFCDQAFGVHYGRPMIGDQMAIGSPEVMSVYAATMDSYDGLKDLGLAGFPEHLSGHISLAQVCWLNGIRVERIPLKLGGLLDPEPLSSESIQNAVAVDAAGRNDKLDRTLLDAIATDHGQQSR